MIDQFRARFGLTFTIFWDPEKRASDAYQTYRYPETLLIGRDGIVVERYIGPREWDSPLYQARLRRLLEGKDAVIRELGGAVKLVDSLDLLVYALLFLLGFGGLAYVPTCRSPADRTRRAR